MRRTVPSLATRRHILYYVEMPNPVVHFEIGCRDTARTQQLYRDLFDWTIQAAGPAAMISEAGIGGHITALGHDPFHYTIFYVEVEDVAAHIAKAEGLGCKKLVGPVTIPTGTFAWIADPDGNTIGLWKPAA
jgi:predicted enzyme related to lactoylglutathione lyase